MHVSDGNDGKMIRVRQTVDVICFDVIQIVAKLLPNDSVLLTNK